MSFTTADRHRLAVLGWIATVATSLSLYPALTEKRFFLIGAGLSAGLVALGMVARQLHLPVVLTGLGQLVVLIDVLLVTYGQHTAYGVVPTPSTFTTVQHLLSEGMDVAQSYAAPVPPSPGLMLMTVGFVAFVALAVDVLAAGLARAPLAGLPLLALYTVPVASLPDGVPAWAFIPGAAAFMALLLVSEHERLSHWGRHVTRTAVRDTKTIDTSGLSSAGRRISLSAIALAVVLPLFVPGFSHQLFHGRGGIGDGNGPGLGSGSPMVSMAYSLHLKDPVDQAVATSPTRPSYLRLAVLDEPGANGWTNSGVDVGSTIPTNQVIPAPAGLSDSIRMTPQSINLRLASGFPTDTVWLPVPFGLTVMSVSMREGGFTQDFAYVPRDQTVTSTTPDALSNLVGYTSSYREIHPTESDLENALPAPDDIAAAYATVPGGVPALVGEVARDVTAGASTDYQRALDLQSFFRDNSTFTYDLDTGYGYGYRAMTRFLQVRRGFCQHFAATMAMMARELGIPSRVVVGFLEPSEGDGDSTYVFTSKDAHAWPELFFNGVGWVRFEPTPGNGATIPAYTRLVAVPTIGLPSTGPTSPSAVPGGGRVTDEPAPPTRREATTGSSTGGSGGVVPPFAWLVLVLVILVALTPAAVRWGIRRARLARAIDGGSSCEYAWLELRDRVIDLRLPWTGSLTPRARRRFVEPLLGGDPDGVAALDRLSLTVERARYAGSGLADAQPGDDVREITTAIGRGLDWKQRLRAFLWPASLMPELRAGWARMRAGQLGSKS